MTDTVCRAVNSTSALHGNALFPVSKPTATPTVCFTARSMIPPFEAEQAYFPFLQPADRADRVTESLQWTREATPRADLPGIDPGSIDIDVDAGVLTLTAHRSQADDGVQWLTSERFSGRYRRQVSLGENIDVARISASYDNGVLSVILPVTERAKPRRIEITRSGSPVACGDRTPIEG